MREIKIEDKELYELMQERNLLVLDGQNLAEEPTKKIQKTRNKTT